MIISLRRVEHISLAEVPTADLLAEIQRRINEAPAPWRHGIIPPPLYREPINPES